MKLQQFIIRASRWAVSVLVMTSLCSCATYRTERHAERLMEKGRVAESLKLYAQLADEDPDKYRQKYLELRDGETQSLLKEAHLLRQENKPDDALKRYREILRYAPDQTEATQGVEWVARDQRDAGLLDQARAAISEGDSDKASTFLRLVLADNPDQAEARQLQEQIDVSENQRSLSDPELKEALRKPVSLEFRNASIQAVFEVLSQASGVNFIFDNDVKTDLKTTIYAKETSITDALDLILKTSQLQKKILNESTLLIYPSTPEKSKVYEDLVMRTFYLNTADPSKLSDMVKSLVNPRYLYVDPTMKMLVVRDNLRVIEAVDRLIKAYDIPPPEVSLDVEILQVSSDAMLNIGLQYPTQLAAHVTGLAGTAGSLQAVEAGHLTRKNYSFTFPDPLAVLNLQQTTDAAKTLANPSIRVRNREKAKIMIGDKVPVVTDTINASSSAISQSVNYLDVGVKLEVQPEVHVDGDVSMNVGLEVSSIVKQITTSTGLLAYELGTSNAETTLRLRDGETQALGGLIQNDDQHSDSDLPFLGRIPVLGWLFSNRNNTHSRSQIVLLITPHVVRSLHTPGANVTEFASGTSNEFSTHALRLHKTGEMSTTRSSLLDAQKQNNSVQSPASDSQQQPQVYFDPNSADVRLELVGPAQIAASREFTLALIGRGSGFNTMQFDINTDQEMEVVSANPVAQTSGFHWSPTPGGLQVNFDQTAAVNGPLAMITLRAKAAASVPARLTIQHPVGKKENGQPLLVLAPPPRPLLVTP